MSIDKKNMIEIDRLDLSDVLNELREVNKAIDFLADILPEFPSIIDATEKDAVSTILKCLSSEASNKFVVIKHMIENASAEKVEEIAG